MTRRIILSLGEVLCSLSTDEVLTTFLSNDGQVDTLGKPTRICRIKLKHPLDLEGQMFEALDFTVGASQKTIMFDLGPKGWAPTIEAFVRKWVTDHGLKEWHHHQPKIYLAEGPDNSVSISPFPLDHDLYESYHWNLLDHHMPHKMTQSALLGCISNVLAYTGEINVIKE